MLVSQLVSCIDWVVLAGNGIELYKRRFVMMNEGLSRELTNLLFLFLSKFLFFLSLSSSLAKEVVTPEVTNLSFPNLFSLFPFKNFHTLNTPP